MDELAEILGGKRPMKLSELMLIKNVLVQARQEGGLCVECGLVEQAAKGLCVDCDQRLNVVIVAARTVKAKVN